MNGLTQSDILALGEQLTERDKAILRALRKHRLLTTTQIRRWQFVDGFSSPTAALRACQRVLSRLEGHRLVVRLQQRVGGVRRGSDSVVWQLAHVGDRLLSIIDGEDRRYVREPGRAFVKHTVATSELAVQLVEAERQGHIEHLELVAEPDTWRKFVGHLGRAEILKPDLTAIVANHEYEDHWAIECDRATEHPPEIVRQAKRYERFQATGAYQREHGLFPAVLWVVPDEVRLKALHRAFARDGVDQALHRVCQEADFIATVLSGVT